MLTSGVGYQSLPLAFVGGEVFYTEETTPNFTIGETVTSGTCGTFFKIGAKACKFSQIQLHICVDCEKC